MSLDVLSEGPVARVSCLFVRCECLGTRRALVLYAGKTHVYGDVDVVVVSGVHVDGVEPSAGPINDL